MAHHSVAFALLLPIAAYAVSCGNCIGSGANEKCNTGDPDAVRPPLRADNSLRATAWSIGQIQNAMAATGQWDVMFCKDYLMRYTNGSLVKKGADEVLYGEPMSGAACVRGKSAAEVWAADQDAKKAFERFGTFNGYASSYAIAKGLQGEDIRKWGTGGGGDVPTNWCGTYMREMFCHIAFPQVVEVSDAAKDPNPAVIDIAENKIRGVDPDTCEDMFRACNRQEVDEDLKSHVVELQNNFARNHFVEGGLDLKNDAWCYLYSRGWGIARAGPGVHAGEFGGAKWESAPAVTASVLVAVLLSLFALM